MQRPYCFRLTNILHPILDQFASCGDQLRLHILRLAKKSTTTKAGTEDAGAGVASACAFGFHIRNSTPGNGWQLGPNWEGSCLLYLFISSSFCFRFIICTAFMSDELLPCF